jgi:uncharacterized repeat protein (TIGR03803 family)
MKTRIKKSFFLPALVAGLGVMLASRATPQTFTTLHIFTASPTNSSGVPTNSDGSTPYAGVIVSGNTLYGTTHQGGSSGNGTVFAVNTDGTSFTNLHTFTATSGPLGTNTDGTAPYWHALLILSGNILYGTASAGGAWGNGTVFALNINGTGFTNLHSFTATPFGTNSDGSTPLAGLFLTNNTLYGTTYQGGSSSNGTVFAINADGTGFTNLHSFASGGSYEQNFQTFNTNSDGAYPNAGVILSGNTLYGVTIAGGTNGTGTVFTVNTNGTGFTILHTFTAAFYEYGGTNSDGANPDPELILSGNTLFGTASAGGISGNGVLFAVNTDGTGFTNLYNFTAASGDLYTNSDGANPTGLILSGHTLYGTAGSGGASGDGDVFALNTDGTDFATLYSFKSGGYSDSFAYTNSDGAFPICELALSGNTLFGTASQGGSSGNGTVFRITLPPLLSITLSGTNVLLSWPTNAAGYTLEWATNLVSPIAWNASLTVQGVSGGQNVVTNPISGSQMFYRLALGQNFGMNWVALRTAMKAAGAINYGHQCCTSSGPYVAKDMFYQPVPTRVIELANANPTLCSAAISTTSGPSPGYGCPDHWEGIGGPQLVGSKVIVLTWSGTPTLCQGFYPYQGF